MSESLDDLPAASYEEMQRALKAGEVKLAVDRPKVLDLCASGGISQGALQRFSLIMNWCPAWAIVPLVVLSWSSLGAVALVLFVVGYVSYAFCLTPVPKWLPLLVAAVGVWAMVTNLPFVAWGSAACLVIWFLSMSWQNWCADRFRQKLIEDEDFFAWAHSQRYFVLIPQSGERLVAALTQKAPERVSSQRSQAGLLHQEGTWTQVSSPTRMPLNSVAFPTVSEGWAVSAIGEVLHYQAGTWTEGESRLEGGQFSVAFPSATEGWAVGMGNSVGHILKGHIGDGTILHYQAGAWTTVSSPPTSDLSSVSFPTASEGWAVGYDGTILHYRAGTWTTVTSPTWWDLHSVAFPTASEGWAVGGDSDLEPEGHHYGTILHYQGGTWTEVDRPPNRSLTSVAFPSVSEGWAVGNNGTIIHYQGIA